jgi:2-isopropylmalate synthase
MKMDNQILIFDTTLRDGEQSPGASLNIHEKLEIARQLEKLNVDIIEAGFPISSPEQFEAVERIAGEVNLVIAGLARAKEIDIKTAYEAIKNAAKRRIHTFIGTSDHHILGKFADSRYGQSLDDKRKTVLQMAVDAVKYAKTFCEDVEFSAEDAGRTDLDYLCEVIEATIAAGATTINIPDTTGYTLPQEMLAKINNIRENVKNIDQAILSVHCHNDLGLAVANSLAAVEGGARQVECTINGIGERAGNASLEEIVMTLKVRKDYLDYHTGINTKEIYNTSHMVSGLTGMVVQPNKAIVGGNAFAHESGIHQDGMLKNRNTYEIMTPDEVGVPKTKIVLGRHSGRHGLKARLNELGYSITNDELKKLYDLFIELADRKKEVYDDDLRVLMGDEIFIEESQVHLKQMQVHLGTNSIPTATVSLKTNGDVVHESATGDGPVDAIFNAIDRALNTKYKIESYQVRSITEGRQAMGETLIRIRYKGKSFTGRGVSTDIIEASAKAYLHAINQLEIEKNVKSESKIPELEVERQI